jgi:hypothetical protein
MKCSRDRGRLQPSSSDPDARDDRTSPTSGDDGEALERKRGDVILATSEPQSTGRRCSLMAEAVAEARRDSKAYLGDNLHRLREGGLQLAQLGCGQGAHVVRERTLRHAHELISVDAALVLEPLVGSDGDLGRKAMVRGLDRSADDRRERRVDEELTTDHEEHARPARVARRAPPFGNAVEIAAPQTSTWKGRTSSASSFSFAACFGRSDGTSKTRCVAA